MSGMNSSLLPGFIYPKEDDISYLAGSLILPFLLSIFFFTQWWQKKNAIPSTLRIATQLLEKIYDPGIMAAPVLTSERKYC